MSVFMCDAAAAMREFADHATPQAPSRAWPRPAIPDGWNGPDAPGSRWSHGQGSAIEWTAYEALEVARAESLQPGAASDWGIGEDAPDWVLVGRRRCGRGDRLHGEEHRTRLLIRAAEVSAATGLPLRVMASEDRGAIDPMLIEPVVMLSMAHLAPRTAVWLGDRGADAVGESGALVHVRLAEHALTGTPEELRRIHGAVRSVASLAYFHCEGSQDDGLPTYVR